MATIYNNNQMIHAQARVTNVVLDIGTYHTFAGEAGYQSPRFASHSYVVEDNTQKKAQYVAGKNALNSEINNKEIYSIFDNMGPEGKVDKFHFDINKLDKFIQTILIDNLQLDNCSISLLIAEDMAMDLQAGQALKQRQKLADYLLEGMELSNIAFVKKPLLASFGLGRTTSVVLDSGHSFSNCTVVEDGYCVYNKAVRFGGSYFHSEIRQEIQKQAKGKQFKTRIQNSGDFKDSDIKFHKLVELENIARKFTSIPFDSTMASQSSQVNFTLPDGQKIQLNRESFIDPFVNFGSFYKKYLQPSSQQNQSALPSYITSQFLKGLSKYRGLHSLIQNTVQEYLNEIDQKNHTVSPQHGHVNEIKRQHLNQDDLLNNVILTGGNLNFGNIGWTVQQMVNKRGGQVVKNPLKYNRDEQGEHIMSNNSLSWVGGSILCELPVFNNFWIKQSEWKEAGATLVSSKAINPETKVKVNPQAEQIKRRNSKMQIISKKCP